jgi:hypothetical protein
MNRAIVATALGMAWFGAPASSRADVQLSINEGVVSLTATNATIPQILAEWGRVGRTTIVNAERIGGGPVTLELAGVPEDRALDTILRTTAGYLAAPRPLSVPNASRFDRILIIPTSTAPRGSAPAQPAFQAPTFVPQAQFENNDAVEPPPGMPMPPANVVQPPRVPGFSTFPNPGGAPPPGAAGDGPAAMPPQGTSGPTLPTGSAIPGMIIQPPPAQQPPGSPTRPQGR